MLHHLARPGAGLAQEPMSAAQLANAHSDRPSMCLARKRLTPGLDDDQFVFDPRFNLELRFVAGAFDEPGIAIARATILTTSAVLVILTRLVRNASRSVGGSDRA